MTVLHDRGRWIVASKRKRLPREAASISCGSCDFCAAVHVNLLNENGDVFATASVPAYVADEFIARFRMCMTEIANRVSAPLRRQ